MKFYVNMVYMKHHMKIMSCNTKTLSASLAVIVSMNLSDFNCVHVEYEDLCRYGSHGSSEMMQSYGYPASLAYQF